MSNEERTAEHHSARMDWITAPICEGAIVLIVSGVGFLLGNPLIFSSLGATGYEQIEKSRSKSARPYNIVVGHFVGLGAGFAAVAMLGVWQQPAVLSAHQITAGRIWASVIAVVLTVAANQLLKATQPAACSTTLLVALGSFSSFRDAMLIVGGVILIAIVGEPLRQIRIRTTSPNTLQ
jgi:HPP family